MWRKAEKNGMVYYTIDAWREKGAEIYVSTRIGGVSKNGYAELNLARHVEDNQDAITENRCRFMNILEIPKEDFISIQQTHSNHLVQVAKEHRGRGFFHYEDAFAETDGIFTKEKGLFMATFYADCLPIACYDPVHHCLGLAHAGWRGTFANIGGELIKEMAKAFQTKAQDVFIAFGPSIGPCCYEVDEAFYENFLRHHEQASNWFTCNEKGCYRFDNAKANRALLENAGVFPSAITDFPLCTCCHQELFYSYRGSNGQCGRHGLFGRLC